MSWEWFNTAAGAASLGSLLLGAILGVVSWRISAATDKLITRASAETQTLVARTSEGTQALITQTTASTQQVLERMDQQANQRQHELMEALKALRG
jgi:hypothetical protein